MAMVVLKLWHEIILCPHTKIKETIRNHFEICVPIPRRLKERKIHEKYP